MRVNKVFRYTKQFFSRYSDTKVEKNNFLLGR